MFLLRTEPTQGWVTVFCKASNLPPLLCYSSPEISPEILHYLWGSILLERWHHTTAKNTTLPFRDLLLSVLPSCPITLQILQIPQKRRPLTVRLTPNVSFSSRTWHLNSDCLGSPKFQFLSQQPWRLSKALLASPPLIKSPFPRFSTSNQAPKICRCPEGKINF